MIRALLRKRDSKPEDLYLENYIKEVFLDTDTDVAAISGLPGPTDAMQIILPPDQMVKTRNAVNQLARSRAEANTGRPEHASFHTTYRMIYGLDRLVKIPVAVR